jgi:hypothetical protein
VQQHATSAAEPLVEGVADEDVREAGAAGRTVDVGDDARRDRLVERVEQRVLRDVAEPGERIERELAPENGGKDERPVARVREMGEPPGDDVADSLGAARRPSTDSRRTISPAKNGLPPVCSCSAATDTGAAASCAT